MRNFALFRGVGFCAVLISWYVSFYYNVIIGWTIYFMVSSMTSELPWVRCGNEWNTEHCWGGHNDTFNITHLPNNRTSPALEFFDRGVLELHLSKGFDDLGAPKWQLVLCVFSVFVILYFALFKGVKSSGKLRVLLNVPTNHENFLLILQIISPNAELSHVWHKNHVDFTNYANEDGTPYLFTRNDYYYKKDVSAGLYAKAEGYGKIWH
ncbi:Sodium-dependent dopamine transporter [Araneus ventricosus]|uniref:Sodium-dependent dopamine transporter n=1 Tax=Araneus ventricosus TaxID=182803 RepID=A0A4Y2T071_ARAVE|nr:Sodium-dependent dopamine transporter [Araneus ventricosus]